MNIATLIVSIPTLASIHIKADIYHNVWLHIVYTDSNILKNFIYTESAEKQNSIYLFYVIGQDLNMGILCLVNHLVFGIDMLLLFILSIKIK